MSQNDIPAAIGLPLGLASLSQTGFDIALVPVFLCAAVGYFGAAAWLLDMANFFRPHIAGLAVVLVLLAALSQSPLRLAIALALLVVAALPLLFIGAPVASAAPVGNFKILTANLMGLNRDTEAFRQLVAADNPDLVVTQETIFAWPDVVRSLPQLPYFAVPQTGVAVASRYPIKTMLLPAEADATPTSAIGGGLGLRIEVLRPDARRPLIVYAIHPPTPRTALGWRVRNRYLKAVARAARADAAKADVIVAGDWNTPSWSPVFSRFLGEADLRSTERRAWPSPTRFFREIGLPPLLGTPVDHIVVSPDIGLVRLTVGQPFGSDHLAVLADLALPQ